jgi:threonine aldolase
VHSQGHNPALAKRLAALKGIELDLTTVQTNIIVFRTVNGSPDAADLVQRAREHGLLLSVFGPRTIRMATHLDVDNDLCSRAADIMEQLASAW